MTPGLVWLGLAHMNLPVRRHGDWDVLSSEMKDLKNKDLRPFPVREAVSPERGWGLSEMLGKRQVNALNFGKQIKWT